MMIGVDIGTTNIKAVAVNEAGIAYASAERRNETLSPQAGWSEQDPEVIWQHVHSVLSEVIQDETLKIAGESIHGIVFSSAMHGFLVVDAAGRPLSNIWLWSDLRADAVARDLRNAGTAIYQQTGVPIHPMSPLCKLLWLRQHQPDIFHAAHKFLGIKEFIWYRLTGKFESDLSCASASGFMNIWKNEWDRDVLALAGITADKLPTLVPPTHRAKLSGQWLGPDSSAYTLIIGASDGALANLGSGATAPGHWAVTIGTSAAIRCITPAPQVDDAMRTFCYRLDEKRCIVGGASNNGANVLEWLRTLVFRSTDTPETFVNQAINVPPGADGLSFLPYIQGERAPLWDAQARGAFQGLTSQHGQAHFVRAAMEGVLFNLKIIAAGMGVQGSVQVLHASGGFSQNHLWVQMLADIFQTQVQVSENGVDASVLGAIEMGRLALGLEVITDAQHDNLILPDAAKASVYQTAFDRFQYFLEGKPE
jgi:gluconokinase